LRAAGGTRQGIGKDGTATDRVTITRNAHPTVKPLKLMQYLLTLGSRPGDTVLDPFLGSGTTAMAAKSLGRRIIGIEREREYFEIAKARVAAI
jgi:site-specific DNA-methyltransferase (adenine-specific)